MLVRTLVAVIVAALAAFGQVMVTWDQPSEHTARSQVDVGEFVISYSYFVYGAEADDLRSVWTLQIFSDGVCYSNYTDIAGGSGISSEMANISEDLAEDTFDGILSEWSDDMLRRYRDLASQSGLVAHKLDVEWHNASIGTVFEGHSMIGVMPWTYARLYNIYGLLPMNKTTPLDVSLEISASNGPGMTTYVSAVFTNNESFNLTQFGATLDLWEGWIVRVNGRFVESLNGNVLPLTWTTFLPDSVTEFSAQDWDWSGASPGFYVVMVRIVILEYIIVTVPDSSGAVNHPPLAEFDVNVMSGNRSTVFEFDALMSWDWEDNGTDLEFRWDWNNDRRWDLEWSPSRLATNQFYEKGEHIVTMQVRDSQGLISETTMVISVEEGGNLLLISVSATLAAIAVATIVLMRRSSKRESP